MCIDDLPLFKLPEDELKNLTSFDGMVQKIRESGEMIVSFAGRAEATAFGYDPIADAKAYFNAAGEVVEVPSCIPGYRRIALKIKASLFDAFEVMTASELLNEASKIAGRRLNMKLENISEDHPLLVCMSRLLKVAMVLGSKSGKYLMPDKDTCNNIGFSFGSLGSFVCEHLAGYKYVRYDGKGCAGKQWVPKSIVAQSKAKQEFIWHDMQRSPLTGYDTYSTLTRSSSLHESFKIDVPVVSSMEDLSYLLPMFELAKMNDKVDAAKKNVKDAKAKLKQSESLVEKMLVEFETSLCLQ